MKIENNLELFYFHQKKNMNLLGIKFLRHNCPAAECQY